MSKFNIALTPSFFSGSPTKPFVLKESQWRVGVEMVERTGYRPNSFSGLSRGDARLFGQTLRQVLAQQEVPAEADRDALGALANFLTGPGAAGVTLSRHWH